MIAKTREGQNGRKKMQINTGSVPIFQFSEQLFPG